MYINFHKLHPINKTKIHYMQGESYDKVGFDEGEGQCGVMEWGCWVVTAATLCLSVWSGI